MEVHLSLVERDLLLDGHAVRVHCHCLAMDANGRVRPQRLAEFMRNAVVDYAIPRSKVATAKARDAKYNSTEAVAELMERAKRSFTDLKNTGEGGEMLLFLLAERFLKLPQILCKMDLKTDSQMHYHGADGVYAGITDEGVLKLYWGESKIYQDAGSAIRECLRSLAPMILQPDNEDAERERDILLLSDKADLNDPDLNEALRRYFDKSSVLSKRVQYCGLALVGFDAEFYPTEEAKVAAEDVIDASRAALGKWSESIGERLNIEKLSHVDIQLFCIPLPSAAGFREAFIKALGLDAK